MINILLGAPGGGKSYEAVVYHIITALAGGRKVITNMPLVLDAFPPEQRALIELREATKAVRPDDATAFDTAILARFSMGAGRVRTFVPRAFANIEDYGDPWRHPETGAGPLYVIDECHLALPRANTAIAVSEWFSLHRHEFADVLLITQSYGKVCKDIVDLVQVCYRVRKAVHLGFSNRYIRKVLDGVRGTVMNESVRHYDPAYFKFYKSHTKSSSAGKELEAQDIVPFWKHWTFKGAAIMGGIVVYILCTRDVNILKPKMQTEKAKPARVESVGAVVAAPEPVPVEAEPSTDAAENEVRPNKAHPLAGLGLHISGYLKSATQSMYLFAVSQNGQGIYTINEVELVKSGYAVRQMNDCIAEVSFESIKFYVTCDAPRISVNPAANMPAKVS